MHPMVLYIFFVFCISEQVVCRACSRNRYPLKYLKDRVAKVCDHCYAELRKRGESQLSLMSGVLESVEWDTLRTLLSLILPL